MKGHGRNGRTGLRSFSVSGRVKEPGVKLAQAALREPDAGQRQHRPSVVLVTRSLRWLPPHAAELRNGVTSPGGTTAAALYELERGGLRTVLSDAIWAAYRRSVELGKPK